MFIQCYIKKEVHIRRDTGRNNIKLTGNQAASDTASSSKV